MENITRTSGPGGHPNSRPKSTVAAASGSSARTRGDTSAGTPAPPRLPRGRRYDRREALHLRVIAVKPCAKRVSGLHYKVSYKTLPQCLLKHTTAEKKAHRKRVSCPRFLVRGLPLLPHVCNAKTTKRGSKVADPIVVFVLVDTAYSLLPSRVCYTSPTAFHRALSEWGRRVSVKLAPPNLEYVLRFMASYA